MKNRSRELLDWIIKPWDIKKSDQDFIIMANRVVN